MTQPLVTPQPDFSVVIPVYNRPEEARAVLAPFLQPEAQGLEVIVVDDGSVDHTADVVAEIAAAAASGPGAQIRLIRQENAGPGPARNTGVAQARADWVLFHDSDDQWMPWTIATFRDTLSDPAYKDAEILFWSTHTFRDPEELKSLTQEKRHCRQHCTMLQMKLNDPLPQVASCNLGMRKAAFQALGGFVSDVRHGEDTDFLFRANEIGPVCVVASPVMMGYQAPQSGTASQTNAGDAIRLKRTLYLINRHRAGLYPGPAQQSNQALGRSVAYTVRGYFAKGYLYPAYAVFVQGAGVFWRARMWSDLIKLPLTPVLHYLRPKNYPFRWRRAS